MLQIKCLSVLFALVLTVSMAGAYDILVWDKDEGDTYSGEGTEIGVMSALGNLGHNATLHTGTTLPTDISGYEMVFALTGWYSC